MQDRDDLLDFIQRELSFALQADLEQGAQWMSELASKEFVRKYPFLNDALGVIADIEFIDEER